MWFCYEYSLFEFRKFRTFQIQIFRLIIKLVIDLLTLGRLNSIMWFESLIQPKISRLKVWIFSWASLSLCSWQLRIHYNLMIVISQYCSVEDKYNLYWKIRPFHVIQNCRVIGRIFVTDILLVNFVGSPNPILKNSSRIFLNNTWQMSHIPFAVIEHFFHWTWHLYVPHVKGVLSIL